jgi:hypothetical protein
VLAALVPTWASCTGTGPTTRTIVTGGIEPRHFQFVTIVKQTPNEPGGWRAACVHIALKRGGTVESYLCKFGVEVPIQNADGPISIPLAQRIAAERTHETALLVFGSATPASPLGMLCETFKTTLAPVFEASIRGSRLTRTCHPKPIPVQLGELVPW